VIDDNFNAGLAQRYENMYEEVPENEQITLTRGKTRVGWVDTKLDKVAKSPDQWKTLTPAKVPSRAERRDQ
jgi:hypothetical protein